MSERAAVDTPVGGSSSSSGLSVGADGLARCGWAGTDPEYQRYHDEEWGVTLHGDRPLFEKLVLEGFQAGLSWITILKRRPTFRAAFRDFDIDTVAAFTEADVTRLLSDSGIIRNRLKIEAAISNARVAKSLIHKNPGALDALLWSYAPLRATPPPAAPPSTAQPSTTRPPLPGEVVPFTAEPTALSRDLRSRGFRFVGPTTLHALMQSSGMVNDHLRGCWRAAAPHA